MKRGASPVITSVLLVLVSVLIAAIFYSWATTSTTAVAGAIYADAERSKKEILSDVTIVTPPPVNEYSTKQPVIIHNSGAVPLSRVSVLYIDPDNGTPTKPEGVRIDVDGKITEIKNVDWPIEQLEPGEAIIIWLPPDNYAGYTIIFTSYYYSKSKTIGVP